MSLLLVEDIANNRLVVNAYLEDEAVNIEEVQNGEDALKRMRNREYEYRPHGPRDAEAR